MFLLYITKFNTNLKRICFCFGEVLGGVTIVLEESFMFVACLYKQIPFNVVYKLVAYTSEWPTPKTHQKAQKSFFNILTIA